MKQIDTEKVKQGNAKDTTITAAFLLSLALLAKDKDLIASIAAHNKSIMKPELDL